MAPTHVPDPPPAWLADALEDVRERDRMTPIGCRSPLVAARLLAALELGADDLDASHRPAGHAAPAPRVRLLRGGVLGLEWAAGVRSVRALVGPAGDLAWRTDDGGDRRETRARPGDPRGYEIGRRALGWLLGREGGERP